METQILPILEFLQKIAIYFIYFAGGAVIIYLFVFIYQLLQLVKVLGQRMKQVEKTLTHLQQISDNGAKISESTASIAHSFGEFQKRILSFVSKSSIDTFAILYRILKERKLKKQLEGDKK